MNTIRDLKQQEKYTNMLKRKNKEKNIYKSKNSTLRIEKMNLIKAVERKDKEIERLNNIIENVTTMTVNGDRTQIKNTAQYKIDKAIEYHDNCVNNLLDLDKIEENERLAYQVAYEIHDNYLNILKGENNE